MRKTAASLICAQLLMFGCASQQSKLDSQYQGMKKTILIGSELEIANRCASNIVTSRHVECIFIADYSDYMPFPEWLTSLSNLRIEKRKAQNAYAQQDYGDSPQKIEYKNLVYSHAFVPDDQSIPFTDTITDNYKYVFFAIKTKRIDGIATYTISPITIQGSNLTPIADYSHEAWKIIDSAFPVVPSDSPDVGRLIESQKAAVAEEEKRKNEQEAQKALDEYRDQFKGAKNKEQLAKFIKTYESNDPEKLIIKAKEQLAVIETEESTQKKKDALQSAEGAIVWCVNITKDAYEAIDREKEIGRISGYVNMNRMHEAGDYISSCDRRLPKLYEEYKKLGGTKTF